ncbi:NAD-dependent epimerase/dehydratase family protein [Micromonospora sp. NPDC005652]|uniref:NAD-dependent epimerase/dehydratase family protein n=1 Tax=Micromonospora sp. NPDC005652 TaxID=3157046 RepID=UPI0033DD495E
MGGAGYIGSVVAAELVGRGHDVVTVDDMIYARDPDARPATPATLVRGDFRAEELLHRVLRGADAVVHLGGLVGEPACAVDEALSVELNFAAPVLAGEVAVAAGVRRYIFLSTCSVYGRQEGLVTESTRPNPLSVYAWTKLAAERQLAEITEGRAHLAVLRLATVFGLSPRMRLDSVVNSMTSRATTTGEIPLAGGSAWRPLVYVGDVANCVRRLVEASPSWPGGSPLILNVGSDTNNHTIADIARTVQDRVPSARTRIQGTVQDARDYRVSFERIGQVLSGACQTPLTTGIEEILGAVRAGRFTDPNAIEFDNLRGLRAALAEGRTAALRSDAMERLRKDYEERVAAGPAAVFTTSAATVETGSTAPAEVTGYDEAAAAAYWSRERLSGVTPGEISAEDAIVLCQGKPTAISEGYAGWESDCLAAMLPDLDDRHVLDLGCGVGRLLPGLAARSGQVTGVDIAPGMLERARARVADAPNAQLLLGSVVDVPMPAGAVDAVVCLGVFEHIPADYRERALAEAARLLRPGGRLLLELNNAESGLLAGARDDNPHRRGAQLTNGYFCELIQVEAVLGAAERLGLTVVERVGNPFFSAARHGGDEIASEALPDLIRHARALDRALGSSRALHPLSDQIMILMVKR